MISILTRKSNMSLENNELGQPERGPEEKASDSGPPAKGDHVITAKDAGWRPSGLFVAPGTLVAIDPPEPKKSRKSS